LWRGRQEIIGVGQQRSSDLSPQVRVATRLIVESVEDCKRVVVEANREPGDCFRLGRSESLSACQ
jgi:hypothetical protein